MTEFDKLKEAEIEFNRQVTAVNIIQIKYREIFMQYDQIRTRLEFEKRKLDNLKATVHDCMDDYLISIQKSYV